MLSLPLRTRVLNLLRSPLRAEPVDRHLVRLTNGLPLSDWRARIPANHYQYDSPTIRRRSVEGISYELDISDFMEWTIYFGVAVEPRSTLGRLARPGDVVIDVGANVGEVALTLANRIGPSGRVFSFEPHPAIARKLERNVALNPHLADRIQITQCALGDSVGEVRIAADSARNRGGVRVMAADEAADAVAVPVRTIDDFAAENHLSDVNLIKIDVEGFEHAVLRGAANVLANFKPALFVELNDGNLRRQGSSAADLVALVEDAGYELRHAKTGAALTRRTDFTGLHCDFIARHR